MLLSALCLSVVLSQQAVMQTRPPEAGPARDNVAEKKGTAVIKGKVVSAEGTRPLRRARLNPPPGWAIKSIDIGGHDYVDAPIEVRGGRRIDGARIVLTNKFPALAGRIVDARGNPTDGTAILFPSDASKWIEDSGAARGTRPDQSGTFRFQSVRPGEYLAIALDYVESWQWNDPEFLESLRDRATKLTLGEGVLEAVTLTLKK